MYILGLIIKSLLAASLAIVGVIIVRNILVTQNFLADVGGLSALVSIFGTLYGIMTAFVVIEVWSQYNKVASLVDEEAHGLERLYRLTLYFRDLKITSKMLSVIEDYANLVINNRFRTLAQGERNPKTAQTFRKISGVIRSIEFNDEHDSIIYNQIVEHYGHLHEIRTSRINQSLIRLPLPLKVFLNITSMVAIGLFVLMPFSNIYYNFLAVGTIAFVLAMILLLIEDLDNPFKGHWNITVEPFKTALKHIKEDYN